MLALAGCFSLISCGLPCFGCCLWDTITLTLETEEAVIARANMCCSSNKRVPYGELGGVEITHACGCEGIGGLGSTQGNQGPVCPGWGSETALVQEVVAKLKERQRSRGDTGQIIRAENNARKLDDLLSKVDAIMAHLGIKDPCGLTSASGAL